MQIDIDFQVFKALTALRESESDSYNAVIRRLLSLPVADNSLTTAAFKEVANALATASAGVQRSGLFGSAANAQARSTDQSNALAHLLGGIWFGNIHFPNGTKFRATYKGRTYSAAITNGQWVGEDGIVRRSPSDAASAISNTNVNGWRFWHVQLPGDPTWRKLDELKV